MQICTLGGLLPSRTPLRIRKQVKGLEVPDWRPDLTMISARAERLLQPPGARGTWRSRIMLALPLIVRRRPGVWPPGPCRRVSRAFRADRRHGQWSATNRRLVRDAALLGRAHLYEAAEHAGPGERRRRHSRGAVRYRGLLPGRRPLRSRGHKERLAPLEALQPFPGRLHLRPPLGYRLRRRARGPRLYRGELREDKGGTRADTQSRASSR